MIKRRKIDKICCICWNNSPSNINLPCSVDNCKAQNYCCISCLYEWTLSNNNNPKEATSCPLCRTKLALNNKIISKFNTKYKLLDTNNLQEIKAFFLKPLQLKQGFLRTYVTISKTKSNPTFRLHLQPLSTLQYPLGPLPSFEKKDKVLAYASGFRINSAADAFYSDILIPFWEQSEEVLEREKESQRGKRKRKCNIEFAGRLVCQKENKIRYNLIVPEDKQVKNLAAFQFLKDSESKTGRRLVVCLPQVDREVREHKITSPDKEYLMKKLDEIKSCQQVDRSDILLGLNTLPKYSEKLRRYSLDFNGRATLPSANNFKLNVLTKEGEEGNYMKEEFNLLFGKVNEREDEEMFCLDFKWPWTPIQAFSAAISMYYRTHCKHLQNNS